MDWKNFEREIENFEKWLVKYKGYRLEIKLCKNCIEHKPPMSFCGANHDGGCLSFYNDKRPLTLIESVTGCLRSDLFMLFTYSSNGDAVRLDGGNSFDLDLEALWKEYALGR